MLNTLAYRLIYQKQIFGTRSRCPQCNHQIAWYDLIPIVSWLILKQKCRYCKQSISGLYPFIELITAIFCTLLFIHIPSPFFPAYFLFFSALIITIRTDLETMLISRFVTIYALPLCFIASYAGWLPLSLSQSIFGAVTAYIFLWLVAEVFFKVTHKVGMGQGDLELLAFIGACTGITGWWLALLIGSLLGSAVGIAVALRSQQLSIKLPFGPFLALGAIFFVLFKDFLARMLLC